MSMRKPLLLALALSGAALCDAQAASQLGGKITGLNLGAVASPDQIASYDIDASPNGQGLPPGGGSPTQGQAVFEQKCQACHGEKGQHGQTLALVGGVGTIGKRDVKPQRTIGSYWPYATSVFAYIRRAMPYDNTKTLSADELYSVTAYLLYLNEIIPQDAVMNAKTLPAVKMPWRDHFRAFKRGD